MKRAALFVALVACNDDPYPNKSEIDSVRILAVRADLPYARPGETVKLEALVVDGRRSPATPMRLWWFPVPCIDPPGGQYYDCYPALEAAFPMGVDLSAQLTSGTTTTVTLPQDALANVTLEPGRTGAPLATSWTFMFACAGHVERIARDGHLAENAAPFACVDDAGRRLSPDDGVFGFTRVTVSDAQRNAIPRLKNLIVRGKPIDPAVGVVVPRCDRGLLEWLNDDCDSIGMGAAFDDADAEIDPGNLGPDGTPGRETIYTDWFVTLGRFEQDRRIEIDAFAGRPSIPDILYEPWRSPGKGTLWVVLHDNRGGTDWLTLPIDVR